jgi:hypothetical protein
VLESFNESFNEQLLSISTSNYLSKRNNDYTNAKTKGGELMCMLQSSDPDIPPQSDVIGVAQLIESGWTRTPYHLNNQIIAILTNLQPAFQYLGIHYNQEDNNVIQWQHQVSQNKQHKTAPICVCRLY